MTDYDFDQATDRRNSDSYKWNRYPEDVVPLWVADMDFRAAPPIIEALEKRVAHGVFGYSYDFREISECICSRMKTLYAWEVKPDQISFIPSVLTGITLVSQVFTEPGDTIMMHTPAYPPFLQIPAALGRKLVTSDLLCIKNGRKLIYEIDFDHLETEIAGGVKLFILCNPHNPSGKCFRREDLIRIHEICRAHNVVVCADEIHSELKLEDYTHTPYASMDPEASASTITLLSPSKTFNLPGLTFAYIITQDEDLRKRLNKAVDLYARKIAALGIVAAVAAYREGDTWLDELKKYLKSNRDYMNSFIQSELPRINYTVPEATYLSWLDCSDLNLPSDPYTFFLDKARVALAKGSDFSREGQNFARINFACRRATLTEGLERMKSALKALRT